MNTRKALSSNLKKILHASSFVLLGFAVWSGPPARAAQHTVEMTDSNTFNPSYLEVRVGDTVTWVNDDWFIYHSSVSTGGYWDSGDLDYGDAYSMQFNFPPGSYPYADYYFWSLGMAGTIVVKPAIPRRAATLMDPIRLVDGRFQFSLSNLTVSATYIIQGSSNLVNWTNLATNVAVSILATWTDNEAGAVRRRFYRSCQLP